MGDDVKGRRGYRAPRRAEQAAGTRRAVLDAARELFLAHGYAATTVAQIAERAGVNVDTLYASVGRKPELLREVVETAISGSDRALPAEQRDYVRRIREATGAQMKIEIYAAAVAEMGPRTAPIFTALRDAAGRDPQCARLRTEVTRRRAGNMLLFAADLRATGELRADLTDDEVADIVWSTNSAEYYVLLVHERGWTPERFGAHLADLWCRMLLAPDG
ncbi:TetR/AcrR family transcriptional regulator [Pseudonocardia abyssalis]|uniref:TetR/AcrR family transcriptional regulator n=1 Tax=Pseudonocardia abyssalis TaxID=2792008 RepID=A0ABS6UY52_9PSEU|nr:TetR/AcrR family transcriptional regulator [Pseudonocardia abyssalis]MBW0115466.1 TetR/AcrR family transcriptional regulator [Pseudonocardia abyssalis]MBW0137195.1 TetR/AcrR family transcriptional regulator [Pseudonocardia abyssalis]